MALLTRPQLLGKFAKQAVKALSSAKANSAENWSKKTENFLIAKTQPMRNPRLLDEVSLFSIS